MHSSVLEIGYVVAGYKTLDCFWYYCDYDDDQLAILWTENSGWVQAYDCDKLAGKIFSDSMCGS